MLACLYNLAINGVYEDLTNPLASNGVEQCLETYNNVVTLNQDSYMRMSKLIVHIVTTLFIPSL